MKKMIMMGLAAAVALPSMAQAQSAAEIRHDNRDIREQREDLRDARLRGDRHDIRDARHDLRDARQERREDWRDYREAHRGDYRRPAYFGPRGYRYRPVTIGYRFAPQYYGARYYINDPWRYRLAPVTGYNRWVRYGNDVVLVNIRTGRVIEVNRDFFW
jgi:Ni/Co efflux regulator RcnB